MEQQGGGRKHYALSAAQVKTAKEPGRYRDGAGLLLLVEPSGARRWKQRLSVRGKRIELGLGAYPGVSLSGSPRGRVREPARRPRGE